MDEEEQAHRDRLKRVYTKRLRLLELRAARQGDTVDPAILTEIEEIKTNIAGLETIEQPKVAPEVSATIRKHFESDLDFLISQFRRLNERITAFEDQVKTMVEQSYHAQEWRLHIADDVRQLQTDSSLERGLRKRGQRFNRALMIVILLTVLAALAIVAWHVLTWRPI